MLSMMFSGSANKVVTTNLVFIFLFLSVVLSDAVGFAISNQIVLPLLQTAIPYAVLFTLLASGQRNRAVQAMLIWALFMGIVTVFLAVEFPARAEATIFHGREYAGEMFGWIRTGIGAEGTPSIFIPQHLIHTTVFCILSLATASFASILMGSILMNYMSYYVASLIHDSTNTWLAILMGWHPWSIIRIASFVVLGVLLGEPLLCKIAKRSYNSAGVRPLLGAAIAGLILDMLMKALIAPWWGITLRTILS